MAERNRSPATRGRREKAGCGVACLVLCTEYLVLCTAYDASDLISLFNNPLTTAFFTRPKLNQIVITHTINPAANPTNKLSGVTYSVKNGVAIAPTHQVRRATNISHA